MKERIKLQQYTVQGKSLYIDHCGNCHQADGSGLRRLIPPLAGNKHLVENQNQLACIIKYGMTGPLELNGINFNETMPANNDLTNLQIAEILTYIGNNWQNELGIIDVNSVNKALGDCSNY